jgi:hypothetical protein
VQRIYLYHWNTGVGDGTTWDSGLIGPDDKARPALQILAGTLGVKLVAPLPVLPPVEVPAEVPVDPAPAPVDPAPAPVDVPATP